MRLSELLDTCGGFANAMLLSEIGREVFGPALEDPEATGDGAWTVDGTTGTFFPKKVSIEPFGRGFLSRFSAVSVQRRVLSCMSLRPGIPPGPYPNNKLHLGQVAFPATCSSFCHSWASSAAATSISVESFVCHGHERKFTLRVAARNDCSQM
jgi:hypothetical protein